MVFDSLEVKCKAGYKADEEPVRFVLDGREKQILEVCDRWYDPEADYFKVKADDGYLYLLRHDRRADEWSLRFVRYGEPRSLLVSPGGEEGGEPN